MIKKLTIALGAAAAFCLLGAAPAHAAESPTAGKVSVAGLLGYGFKDGLGLGLGVRGGYTLPMNLYLGGTFVYHLGKSQGDTTFNLYYFGVEGGYDIAAGPVVVRPYLGLGPTTFKATVPTTFGISGDSSDTRIGFWPGATVLYPLGSAFIGGDARFLVVEDGNAFNIFATGGVQF